MFKLYNQIEKSAKERRKERKELPTQWKSKRNIDVFRSYRLYPWLTWKSKRKKKTYERREKYACKIIVSNTNDYIWIIYFILKIVKMMRVVIPLEIAWFTWFCFYFCHSLLFVSLVTSHQDEWWSHLLCVFLVVFFMCALKSLIYCIWRNKGGRKKRMNQLRRWYKGALIGLSPAIHCVWIHFVFVCCK